MKIYKYQLKITDIQTVSMPKGAEILSAQEQHGEVCIWALVNPEEHWMIERTILIIGTGNPIDDDIDLEDYFFVGTVQCPRSVIVWHVFAHV
jgi:hypothetical protein